MSLFDDQDLAEIAHPDFPSERLIACRNPSLAEHRATKREDLLAATETELATIRHRVAASRPAGAGTIGLKVGAVLNTYKLGKHLEITITDDELAYTRNQTAITAEAALAGIYVIRTCLDE